MMVAWSQPNRLAVRAYQGAVACDGQRLQAKILDEGSADLDGQIVSRPIGEKLTLDDLFSDAVLRENLGGRLGLHPPQLELLLAEKPFQAFLDKAVPKVFLRREEFDGRACERVEVNLQGRYVFWVDRENYLLRRLEYPGDVLLTPEEAQDAELQIAAEFPGAELDAKAPAGQFTLEAFQMAVPADAKQVRFFVVPPQPLPTEIFGKRPAGFEFLTLEGQKVTPQTLAGKVAVLAWFTNHPGSQACLQTLDGARAKLAGNEQIVFYAVCTEPTTVSNDDLRQLASDWNITIPVVRDLGAYGRDAFDVQVAPSLVVLDAKGAVQIHEPGDHSQLAALVQEQLPELLPRLAGGEDFAAAILTQAQAEQENYQLNLKAARGEIAAAADAAMPAEVAPKTQPQKLQLSPAWSNEELDSPGNMIVIDNAQTPRLLVLDGPRTFAELDEQGAVVRRTELELPEQASLSFLRTAADNQGRRIFAGASLLAPRAFVFDEQGKRLLAYPPEDQKHDGVRDVLLADLDGSGKPSLAVGFWGLTGVHGVSLAGERTWVNRELAPVLSLAATPPDVVGWRKVLATGNAGHIQRLNQYGNADPPIQVKQRTIHHLIAADWSADRPTVYLGLSYAPEGNLVAIGLNANFEEMWSYRLPPGAYANQMQFAAPCRLLPGEGGQWLLAGPDGSIHMISDDGDTFDYFQYGERLTGLAGFRSKDQGILAVATEQGVFAYKVKQ
jgi:hypothetical protein